nr:MAG TPA: hypothetical protein [Caudoviricetes sp.]
MLKNTISLIFSKNIHCSLRIIVYICTVIMIQIHDTYN